MLLSPMLHYKCLATPSAREMHLDSVPAVYAWYRTMELDAVGEGGGFADHLLRLIGLPHSRVMSRRHGYLYSVSIQEIPSSPSLQTVNAIREIARGETGRRSLARSVGAGSAFFSPLYIGKATDLRARVSQHVEGDSGLRSDLAEAGIMLAQCGLRYLPVAEEFIVHVAEALGLDDDAARSEAPRILEDVLTRAAPAAFVRRPG
jgi:hypothetical protein